MAEGDIGAVIDTLAGKALVLNSSLAVQVSGYVTYYEE